MLIDTDIKLIGMISLTKIAPFKDLALETDWSHFKFNRFEQSLVEGRLCTLPYPIRADSQKEYTESQKQLVEHAMPIVSEILLNFEKFTPVRGEIVNLLPGKELKSHIDIYWFHKYSKRIHVPIYTNDQCVQIFEDREHHLEEGKIYEINNRIMHSARNSGSTPRIHLILDLMDFENLEKLKSNKSLATTIE